MAEVDRVGRAIEVVELRRKDLEMQPEVRRRLWDARQTLLNRIRQPWAYRRRKGAPK